MTNFEHLIVPKFPVNDKFHSRETAMILFPGTGTGMDALVSSHSVVITEIYSHTFSAKISWKQRFY